MKKAAVKTATIAAKAKPDEALAGALADARRRLDDVTRLVSDWVWETDADLRLTSVSHRVFEVLRILPHELIGSRLEDLGTFVDKNGEPLQVTWRAPFRDIRFETETREGDYRTFLVSGLPVFDAARGTFQGTRGTAEDVTERKRAEEALRQSEERATKARMQLEEIIDILPSSVNIYDSDDRLVLCNRVYRDLYEQADFIRIGARKEDIIRAGLERGFYPSAWGREEDWFRERIEYKRSLTESISQSLVEMRSGWRQILERRTRDGGTIGVGMDVSELICAQEALRESEQRFRDFVEVTYDRIWETDGQHQFTIYTAARWSESRLTPEEVLGKTPWELYAIDPYAHEHWRRHMEDLEARRPFHDFEHVFVDEDGEEHHWSVSGKPIFDADGRFEGYRGTARNITETKKAEKAIRDSEARFRSLFEDSAIAASLATPDGRFAQVNEALCDFLGYTEAELLSMNVAEVTHPDDVETTVRARLEVIRGGTDRYRQEKRYVRKDGAVLWGLLSISVIRDETGTPRYSLGQVQDITERKKAEAALSESEARLRAFMEHSPNTVALKDTEGRYTLFNPASERTWRLSAGEVVGRTTQEVFPDELATRFQEQDRRIMRTGEAMFTEENMVRRDDERTVFTVKFPVRTVEGKVTGIGLIGTDVTELKRAEEALRRAKEEAKFANRAKSDFLSSMSHELRTPMNAILGFAQLLDSNLKEEMSERQAVYVRHILDSGNHLLELINDVLELAKIEAGKIPMSIQTVAAGDVIAECVVTAVALGRDAGIAIEDESAGRSLPPVRADQTRFKQALLNILSNAIKYNRTGGRVTVTAAPTDERRLRVSVTDEGSGIPENRRNELFRPFSRLGVDDSGIEGTGIGLAITRQLMDLMGGGIGFESALGQGSTFWVELPLADTDGPEVREGMVGSVAATVLDGKSAETCTVLYVEDNPANLRLMGEIVARLPGMRMISAHTGELGVALAREHCPDVIVMDINLPGMNGLEALSRLRERQETRAIPIIALSANTMPKDVERGLALGFNRYLTKPIDVGEVGAALEWALSDRSPRRSA